MSRRERVVQWTAIGLAAYLAIAAGPGNVAAEAGDADRKQTIGAVTAVEPDARQIKVITGTGHALRVVVFHVGPACRIEVDGTAAPLTSLKRGRVVDVRYRSGPPPLDAESITTRPPPDAARTP